MSDKVLILRTNPADGTSYGGFVWPESGPVEAPDWNDRPECGGGLHGLLWGCGVASLLHAPRDEATVWRVMEVDAGSVVDLGGKVKFPRGVVAFCGNKDGALAYLDGHGAADKPVVYAARTAGDLGTATAGDRGTATAGYGGTATAGYGGTATAGDLGTATAGDLGTATAGDLGTATAGDEGTATAGNGGTATAGDLGTATAGDGGTATAGYRGTVQIKRWDTSAGRYRIVTGYIGEDGLLPDAPYRLDHDGDFVRADQ